jgi:excisionase family DNA binding protein
MLPILTLVGHRLTLTITEAAEALGISRSLAYEMAATGSLPTLRFGRRLVVPRVALDRLLDSA